ncbi:hypothetical protein MPLA_670012 [Mesorhizobium sp. ORS 3359]|nr:hypothetical protein MPLA_670012 [Mesorhizobium sp. ORS 3359]
MPTLGPKLLAASDLQCTARNHPITEEVRPCPEAERYYATEAERQGHLDHGLKKRAENRGTNPSCAHVISASPPDGWLGRCREPDKVSRPFYRVGRISLLLSKERAFRTWHGDCWDESKSRRDRSVATARPKSAV